jgi:hypothetical protein
MSREQRLTINAGTGEGAVITQNISGIPHNAGQLIAAVYEGAVTAANFTEPRTQTAVGFALSFGTELSIPLTVNAGLGAGPYSVYLNIPETGDGGWYRDVTFTGGAADLAWAEVRHLSNDVSSLAAHLSRLPANTPGTAYTIELGGLDLGAPLANGRYPLGELLDSLSGKYVNLDLSYYGDSVIFGGNSSSANRSMLLSVILPTSLTSIDSYASRIQAIP